MPTTVATHSPAKRSAATKAVVKSRAAAPTTRAVPARKLAPKAKPLAVAAKVPASPPAKPTAPEPAARVPKAAKLKLVRDSFTMPADEYAVIGALKQRALSKAHPAKKSELLRAGIKLLSDLGDAALIELLTSLPTIKTGRPKSGKAD